MAQLALRHRTRLGAAGLFLAPAIFAVGGSFAIVSAPRVAAILVGFIFAALVVIRLDRLAGATLTIGALPWLVVFGNVLPPFVKTFAAAAAAVAFYSLARPNLSETRYGLLMKAGLLLFFVPVIISLFPNGTGVQFIEAAKYTIFPTMAVSLVAATRTAELDVVRRLVWWSAVAALTAQLLLGLAGLGGVGTFYHSGERLGFASAHDIALLATVTAGAAAALPLRMRTMLVGLGIATLVVLQSGVRSALVGLVVLALLGATASHARVRWIVAIGAVVSLAVAIGATNVISNRLAASRANGEFTSFATYGSGRGEIWSSALHAYGGASGPQMLAGTGLRSITKFEDLAIGEALVGHSDVIQVLVELGAIGFAGLLLMWFVLIRQTQRLIAFAPLVVFALLNGTLEYGAPLVVGLALIVPNVGRDEPSDASAPAGPGALGVVPVTASV